MLVEDVKTSTKSVTIRRGLMKRGQKRVLVFLVTRKIPSICNKTTPGMFEGLDIASKAGQEDD